MCHLDVKPDNILLAAPLSSGVAPQFKLADFGLTVPLYGADSPLERGELHAEGDRKFCSREIMSGRLTAETLMSADIFALGLTIYALARGSQFGPLPRRWSAMGAIALRCVADVTAFTRQAIDVVTRRQCVDECDSVHDSARATPDRL
jgi:serine/threonine protein kinase